MSNIEVKRNFTSSHNDLHCKKIKADSLLDQEFINFSSVPPLQSIANVKVATLLCSQTHVRDAIKQHSMAYDSVYSYPDVNRDNSLKDLELRVLNNLSLVQLPNIVKADVANIVTPVLLQILKWIHYDGKHVDYMDSICWTIEGTIDIVKTFELLLYKDSAQQYTKSLYELACEYCIEDAIPNLWNKLPATIQKDYGESIYKKYEKHLLAYWTSIVKDEQSELLSNIKPYDDLDVYDCNNSIYQNMFELAVYAGNVLAVKYFLNKLKDEEKSTNLRKWIEKFLNKRKYYYSVYQGTTKFSDVLYFLLSQVDDPKYQREVFEENSEVILISLFLYWPWQRFLLPVIQTIWCSLSEETYLRLLRRVVDEIRKNKTTEKLLRRLWLASPINFKKYFIRYTTSRTDVYFKLMHVTDVKTIKLILNYASTEQKRRIIFCAAEYGKIYDILYENNLSLLDMLISETLSSDSDVLKLKAGIAEGYGSSLCHDWIQQDNLEMLENFLNWVFSSQAQINHFKNKDLDKVQVTYRLIKKETNFELIDKFLSWCFSTEQEIDQFKKNFAYSLDNIVGIGKKNWEAFEKVIRWCLMCDEDINDFKCNLLKSDQIMEILCYSMEYGYELDFIDNFIHWCCCSNEEITRLKAQIRKSTEWFNALKQSVSNYNHKYRIRELTEKLIKLVSPLEEEVIKNLKEQISTDEDFTEYLDSTSKEELFRLIDYYIIDDNKKNQSRDSSDSDD